MKRLLVLLLCWFCASVWATDIPTRIEISYAIVTDIGDGEINEVLSIDHYDDALRYNINSVAQATGIYRLLEPNSIVRHSEGVITQQGLKPTRAYEKRGKKEPSLTEFNWKNHVVTLHHKGRHALEELPEGTLDRLSLSYNFMFAPLPKHHVDRYVTNGRELRLSRYQVTEEMLKTPIGRMKTIVLTRIEEKGSKLRRKIWLALNNHMIPVRIMSVEENGREIEKMVTGINIVYKTESE
ncbi:MAG: DUF3108 domain-containing protein [Nitrosomonas sp.]|nr:MAG: DUF3108 domain-containing protein [Nitrosomonas sp.]